MGAGLRTTTILLCAACLAPALSCDPKPVGEQTRAEFDRIAAGALDLYRRIHPLRWSSLGLEGADSLLFAFTGAEIERSAAGLDSLVDLLSSLPAAGLDRGRIDDSLLLLDWMKGERFALGPDGACRSNPLLYCWMLEEALFGMPSRPAPPGEGEGEAYAARLGKIPALCASAARLLERPGAPLLEEARRRLDRVAASIPALRRSTERRYGRPVPGLDRASAAVDALRETFGAILAGRPRGRVIMGLENLAFVLGYAEHLDADPSSLIGEAEAMLRRPSRRAREGSERGRGEAGGSADPESLLVRIEAAVRARGLPGSDEVAVPVVAAASLYTPLRIPVDPYLTVPVLARRAARAEPAGSSGVRCGSVVAVDPGAAGAPLLRDLLLCCSAARAPEREACLADSPLRLVFSTQTFRRGWETAVLRELLPLFPDRAAGISRIEEERRVLALARMVVVFRLHAGLYTTQTAAAYLTESTGLPADRVAEEIAAATASPAAAFEGIAEIMLERLEKRIAGRRGAGGRLRVVLFENGMLPLPLIEKKLPS